MLCECCNKNHNGTYGSGRFCSESCARSFSSREKRREINKKVSKTLKEKVARGEFPPPRIKGHYSFSEEALKKIIIKNKQARERRLKLWSEGKFQYKKTSTKKLRDFMLSEQNGRCNICGSEPMWNGRSLTFQINHIDGNNKNNERSNLELICPNCHTQTENWGYKK